MFRLYDKINNDEVYIIAEMSANHGGSLENALELVRQVSQTGADCLKIQTYTADSLSLHQNCHVQTNPLYCIHPRILCEYAHLDY